MDKKQKKEARKFTSARATAAKQESGFSSNSIKVPEGVKLLKLKEGTMLLDIIPFKVGKNNPNADEGQYHYERSFHVHRNIGPNGGTYVCLAQELNQKCPICEYRARLKADPDADEKMIKEMAPKHRQLFNVVDRRDPDAGIQLLEMSYHLFGKLLNERIGADEDDEGWDRFFSPTEGFTLRLTVKEDSMGENKFLRVSAIDLKPRKEQYEEEIVDQAHCLDDLIKVLSYAKLKDVLLQTGDDDDDADDDDEKPAKKSSGKSSKKDDDDWDDEDEKPAKSSKKDDDDDADDDPPKKSSKGKSSKSDDADDDDDDPEPPKKAGKKSSKDDDADDDSDDDDDDDKLAGKSSKKSKDDSDDDDDADDDDEKPAKKSSGKSSKKDDDDWDDEDEKPAKSSKKDDDDDDE